MNNNDQIICKNTTASQPHAAGDAAHYRCQQLTDGREYLLKGKAGVMNRLIARFDREATEDEKLSVLTNLNSHAQLLAQNESLRAALVDAIPHLNARADLLHSEHLEFTGKTSLDLLATSEMVRAISRKASEALRNEVRK